MFTWYGWEQAFLFLWIVPTYRKWLFVREFDAKKVQSIMTFLPVFLYVKLNLICASFASYNHYNPVCKTNHATDRNHIVKFKKM